MQRQAKILIIGGGPGGRVSYMALRQMGVDSVIMVANEEPTVICSLPYSVGRRLIPDGPEATVVKLERSHRLPPDMAKDILQGNVLSVDLASRTAEVKGPGGRESVLFEQVILAPGAVPWLPPLEGVSRAEGSVQGIEVMIGDRPIDKGLLSENVHVLRGANDARRLDALAAAKKRAVVVGTGAIGLETAEALTDRGMRVTLAEALPHMIAALDADLAARVETRLRERGVEVRTKVRAAAVTPQGLRLEDGSVLESDAVIFATGVKPNLRLARQMGLATNKGIVVDGTLRTSAPAVYAVGDAAEVPDGATGRPILPLIGTLAMRQAMVAAGNAAGREMRMPSATVWGVSEIFGLHWASVGWSEEAALREGMPVFSLALPVRSRDPFMPSGKEGVWKLVVSATDGTSVRQGQILGFQAVTDGDSPLFLAERFIDIVTRRETVRDLFGHFFVHSPAHNAVDDPYLGFLMRAETMMRQA